MTDADLLRTYAEARDQSAFAELVRRHADLVYSAARRQAGGDHHRAQEITQHVFLTVARQAASLARHPVLIAWLHHHTRLAAANHRQAEARRATRETRAATDPTLPFNSTSASAPDSSAPAEPQADWSRVEPLLDDALATLGEHDRQAVLLRYFSGHAYADIGRQLGLAENAARMRTERALDKLRQALAKRGVTSTASALGLALTGHAVTAAPASVAASTLAAIGSTSAAVSPTATLTGADVLFSTTMTTATKLTLGATAVALFSLGLGTGVVTTRVLHPAPPPVAAPLVPPPAASSPIDGQLRNLLAQRDAEIATLRETLSSKETLLAEQNAALKKLTVAEQESAKRRVFRDLDELGKYTAEVSLRMLDLVARYQSYLKNPPKPDSPEALALQKEFAQVTQDSAVLLEDPLFLDEMKSGDPARITALQLSYIGEMLKFTPDQRAVFTREVAQAYRSAYEQKLEWAVTDPRLADINKTTVAAISSTFTPEQRDLWNRARLNRLLFNFAIGAP